MQEALRGVCGRRPTPLCPRDSIECLVCCRWAESSAQLEAWVRAAQQQHAERMQGTEPALLAAELAEICATKKFTLRVEGLGILVAAVVVTADPSTRGWHFRPTVGTGRHLV